LSEMELRKVGKLIEEHEDDIRKAWYCHFRR
jgi:hypothetical protein